VDENAMSFGRPKKQSEPLTEAALYDYALASLGRRTRTVSELKRLMYDRVERGETGQNKIDAVIARLKEYKFLDDAAFATDFTRLRQENEKFGKRRVQQELARKGVNSELISTTLTTAYEDISEEDLARRHLTRKRVKQPTNEKEAARVMRLLIRAGFSPPVIYKILKTWAVDEESLATLDSEADPE
jgi:regulatory protein